MSDTRVHSSLPFLAGRTGQVACIVISTFLHIFSMGFISGLSPIEHESSKSECQYKKKEREKERKKKEKKYGKITQISASLTFIALPMEHRYLLKRTT